METKQEILRKYLPMIFELDFSIAAPNFVHSWHNMSWSEFEREMQNNGINCADCKIRDWKEFFISQQEALNKNGGHL